MDGYMYNLDPYHQVSTGYYASRYQPSYALERRSSYGLPSTDSYARVPIDRFAGYGAPVPYRSEAVHHPRYVSAPTSPVFRSRPRSTPKKKAAPTQNLGPKKKLFKQTQKVRFSEEKEHSSSKKDAQRKPSQAAKRIVKPGTAVPLSQAASLAKETQELHNLFRTGVDTRTGGKPEGKKGVANGAAKKRKADTQMQKLTPTKNSESAKKQKGKKSKKLAKDKKEGIVKVELPLPTEEEMKQAGAALEMQRGFCKSVSEFFGFPETKEVAIVAVVESDGKGDESKEPEKDGKDFEKETEAEKPSKPEETQRTPEEEKEIEATSFKFFSSMFAEHQELRNLYVDKCNAGSFECLVCHSADATKSKKFWNLVSLVTHTKMRKKMRGEHSGFGRAVSAVLGWDHEKTPKVPQGSRPAAPAKKPTDQGKEVTKQETVEEALDDQVPTEAQINDKEEDDAAESPSKDVIEE